MGLFGKKDPCAICGGKVSGIFPSKIEGKYVCSDCYGIVDLPSTYSTSNMTIEEFRGYMQFREENALLKEKFQITNEISFGFFDTKFALDTKNRLLCMDKFLGKTIFEGKNIKSFVIKEDLTPIYEGNATGLIHHVSTVPDRAREMAPQLAQAAMWAQMKERMERNKENGYVANVDIQEPFKQFNLEIRFDHPYWDVFQADMTGPTFNNDRPDLNDYLNAYENRAKIIDELAHALMLVAFPGAPEQTIAANASVIQMAMPVATATLAAAPDVVEEIQRFKALMDQGIITEEEFAAKKRQLLGI